MINNRLARTLLGIVLTKAAVVGAWYLYQAKFDAKDQDFKDNLDKQLDEEFGVEKDKDISPNIPETEKIVRSEVKARQAKKVVAPKKTVSASVKEKAPAKSTKAKPVVKTAVKSEVKEAPAKVVRKPRAKKSV